MKHCRIAKGWFEAGKEGIFHKNVTALNGMVWAVVQWKEEDDPDLHKASGIEVLTDKHEWVAVDESL
jgi:hypothetical protein